MSTLRARRAQFGVYKLDINQGNYITQDMVDKLKVGPDEAAGPADPRHAAARHAFRDNRWDYVYEYKRQGRVLEHRKFTVYFVDDKLARWEGDEMPLSVRELNRERRDARAARRSRTAERQRRVGVPRRLQRAS